MVEGLFKYILLVLLLVNLLISPISSQNKILVGIDKNYPPHEFVENGQVSGFNIDILNAIGKEMNIEFVYVPDKWETIYNKLKNNEIDVLCISSTPERNQYFDFTKASTLDLSLAIFVKKDVFGITEIKDLKNYTVSLRKGDISEQYLREHKIDAIIVPVESQEGAFNLLEKSAVFAFLGNKYTGLYLKYKSNYNDIKIIGDPISIGARRFAVKKGNNDLRNKLDQGFLKIKQLGIYDQIYKKWVGYSYESYFKIKRIINIVLIFSLILVVVIVGIIIWNRVLKIMLNRKMKELIRLENKYSNLVNNIKSGIVCLDNTNKIIIANPAFKNLLNIDEENITNINIFRLKFFSSGYNKLADFIKERQNITKNLKLIINDIEYILKTTGFTFINEQNKEIYTLIIDNITEPEIMKEQLLETQKMDALSRLIMGITHSFNNIITGIMSSSEILKKQTHKKELIDTQISTIEKLADKAKELTDKLSTFNKNQLFHPEMVNINELLINSQGTLKALINENIELNLFLNDNVKPIQIDINQFNQLILNLAINAQEAMPDGGKIVIETKNVILDRDYCYQYLNLHEGEYVVFQFTDSGVGITEDLQKHIFEPFFSTKKHVYSGLGLSIVYGIVKQNNGDIKLYSEKGHGTTFKIFFPVYEKEEKIKTPPTTESSNIDIQIKNKHILIVEDDQDVRELIDQFLKINELIVDSFKDGKDTLAFLDQFSSEPNNKLDFLIIDLVTGY